jgi:hypothetical protein
MSSYSPLLGKRFKELRNYKYIWSNISPKYFSTYAYYNLKIAENRLVLKIATIGADCE